MPLSQWQAGGNDVGTTAAPYASGDALISLARSILA